MSLSLSEQKKQQLETASQNLKQNLKKLGISIGYKAVSYTHLTLPTIYSV